MNTASGVMQVASSRGREHWAMGDGLTLEGSTERPVERLPFRVRVASGPGDLAKAIGVRHTAYSKHLSPLMTEALREPEVADTAPGTVLLLAESKLDGSALGSMRIQTNAHGPLKLEQAIDLPQWMAGKRLAEATRLAVAGDKSGHLVKTVMVKAGFLYCVQNAIHYMLITARAPVDRQYDRLLFRDVFPEMGYMPMQHVFNLPHRVMYFDVFEGETLWSRQRHPLLNFMRGTEHPDIDISGGNVVV